MSAEHAGENRHPRTSVDDPCCDFREHDLGVCQCTEHPESDLHPFGFTSVTLVGWLWWWNDTPKNRNFISRYRIDPEGKTVIPVYSIDRERRVCWDCEVQWDEGDVPLCVDTLHRTSALSAVPPAHVDDADQFGSSGGPDE